MTKKELIEALSHLEMPDDTNIVGYLPQADYLDMKLVGVSVNDDGVIVLHWE